jgi:hypothetical protein
MHSPRGTKYEFSLATLLPFTPHRILTQPAPTASWSLSSIYRSQFARLIELVKPEQLQTSILEPHIKR